MTVLGNTLKAPAGSDSNGEVVVSVRGLTKVFKDFWGRPKARAVDSVDFQVRRGEVFGLLGPNGSGKSTTVKLLLGLLYPTKGHIEVFGHSPRHVATKSRIGYLPEESYLYRYLNSRETLQFFGNLFELPRTDRQKRSEQLLEMVGLSQAHLRAVGEFSKGMQRRIGLAQALINDPDLVILDEPTSGLDPIGCREVKDLIVALARRGKTVILSSHLLSDVEDDQVGVVNERLGQADAALHAFREFADRAGLRLVQSDHVEQLGGAVLPIPLGQVKQVAKKIERLARIEVSVEIGFLGQVPNAGLRLDVSRRMSEDLDVSFGRIKEPEQQLDGCRCSRPVRTEQAETLAAADFEIDVVDGARRGAVPEILEDFGEPADRDDGLPGIRGADFGNRV